MATMMLVSSSPAPKIPETVAFLASVASNSVRLSILMSKPRKLLRVTKLTTPATGSEPKVAEPPSSNSSVRCTAIRGTSELIAVRYQPVPVGLG